MLVAMVAPTVLTPTLVAEMQSEVTLEVHPGVPAVVVTLGKFSAHFQVRRAIASPT